MSQKRYKAVSDGGGRIVAVVDPDTGKPVTASSGVGPLLPQGTGLLPEVNAHRERLIEDAVRDRKIAAGDGERYRHMYDRDPVGTQQLLASLAPNPSMRRNRGSGTGLLPELEQD